MGLLERSQSVTRRQRTQTCSGRVCGLGPKQSLRYSYLSLFGLRQAAQWQGYILASDWAGCESEKY